jgi:glycosyltransferase involved in cell wall biosynthesis
VDDFSTDGTRDRLQELARQDRRIHVLYHDRNQGKGAALRTGFTAATGNFVVVQDADLEYDPNDLPELIRPLVENQADVVFGSRFINANGHSGAYFSYAFSNRFLTRLSNFCTGLNVTDMETCYKVFRREIIQSIPIHENRFGFEPEITAKIARYRLNGQPLRIREVGISYHRRSSHEGKKLRWRDGLRAVWCIFKYSWS